MPTADNDLPFQEVDRRHLAQVQLESQRIVSRQKRLHLCHLDRLGSEDLFGERVQTEEHQQAEIPGCMD